MQAVVSGPSPEHRAGEAEIIDRRLTVLGRDDPLRVARPAAARRRHGLARIAGTAAIVAALVPALASSGGPARHALVRSGSEPGAAGVATAYGYPGQCLSVTILHDHPAYARADFNHGRPCGRYAGDTTTILHRSDGAWHVVLDAPAYSCPLSAVPLAVQAELGVCDIPARALTRAAHAAGRRRAQG